MKLKHPETFKESLYLKWEYKDRRSQIDREELTLKKWKTWRNWIWLEDGQLLMMKPLNLTLSCPKLGGFIMLTNETDLRKP